MAAAQVSALAAISWRFQERGGPGAAAESLAGAMQQFRVTPVTKPSAGLGAAKAAQGGGESSSGEGGKGAPPFVFGPERYLDGSRLFLDPASTASPPVATAASLAPLVAALVGRLTPAAAGITLVAPEFKAEAEAALSPADSHAETAARFPPLRQLESWYGTPYALVDTAGLLDRCAYDGVTRRAFLPRWVRCPPPNSFMPTRFTLKAPLVTDDPGALALAAAAAMPSSALSSREAAERERSTPPHVAVQTAKWCLYHKQVSRAPAVFARCKYTAQHVSECQFLCLDREHLSPPRTEALASHAPT